MTPSPASVEDRAACFRHSIERLTRFAPGAPFICNTGAHPKGDMAEAMTVVIEQLKALAPVVADHGVRIALEPLNPTSVNVESGIWTVEMTPMSYPKSIPPSAATAGDIDEMQTVGLRRGPPCQETLNSARR